MKNTYELRLAYPKTFSLHKITSLVESVHGVRIQHLSFNSKGKQVVGLLVFEASDSVKYDSVMKLIKEKNEVWVKECRAA